MKFKELLSVFAAKYGVDGLDGVDGTAALDVDGVSVELLDDPQTQSVLACAEIGLPPPDANGVFGALMLQANFMLRGTEGATLCQNPESGSYAIVRSFPLALTDVESFGAGLESLVNQTENWRKMLTSLRLAEDTQKQGIAAAPEGDSHQDMLSNGYFHV